MASNYTLHLGDCLEVMPGIADGSADFIFTDPPYPYIKREYGYWTEETWIPMMQEVVRQGRRILKPHGSMVMILQPNSEKVGKMRPWLWKFMVWCCEEWNMVQDAYWWNIAALPTIQASVYGFMRPSIKPIVWLGAEDCYRNQDEVLLPEAHRTANRNASRQRRVKDGTRVRTISGHSIKLDTIGASTERGRATPFNCLPHGTNNINGNHDHGAGTPLKLTAWWLRYLTKPSDTVLDPFNGSGTTGVAALNLGRKYTGIERVEKYYQTSQERIGQVERELRGEQLTIEGFA